MPKYHGKMNENISIYLHQVNTFFKAKNLDPMKNPNVEPRCLAMIVANFRGQAAAWYQDRLANNNPIRSITELAEALRNEFQPPDLQERLRDQLYSLQQKNCRDLQEYVEKFRRIVSQIEHMTMMDKVTHFSRGLRLKTREEVKYKRCSDVTQAIQVALEYERSHAFTLGISNSNGKHEKRRRFQYQKETKYNYDAVAAGEESADMDVNNVNSRREKRNWRKKAKCYNCNQFGHISNECKQPKKKISRHAPPSKQHNVTVTEDD